eukprot:4966261-Prymnesium_polylepis.1
MYTFDKNGPVFDEKYKGGSRRERISITETQPRQNPQRESKAPSLTITLSKEFLQQLRSGNPLTFQKLVNLVREFDEQKKQTTTVTAPKEAVQEIRQDSDRGRHLLDQVVNKRPVRRSPRLVELDDTTTQATIEAPRRRSPRLAAN